MPPSSSRILSAARNLRISWCPNDAFDTFLGAFTRSSLCIKKDVPLSRCYNSNGAIYTVFPHGSRGGFISSMNSRRTCEGTNPRTKKQILYRLVRVNGGFTRSSANGGLFLVASEKDLYTYCNETGRVPPPFHSCFIIMCNVEDAGDQASGSYSPL